MIKLNPKKRTIRETTAKFEYMNGTAEIKTDDIRVLYYSPTVADSREELAAMKSRKDAEDDSIWWLSDSLLRKVHSLPDLCDEKGKEHKLTREFYESLDFKNLDSILSAINEDLSAGKSQPAK